MSTGFLIFAQNNDIDDYVKQAYLCALSGHASGNKYFTLVTDVEPPKEYKSVFDNVIVLENDESKDADWKIENRWKAYDLTPYEHTVVLDSDTLILNKIDFTAFDEDVYFTQNPITYRGEDINATYYRKAFFLNHLPNIYMGMYYFKKCDSARHFFEMLQIVMHNWREFYKVFCFEAMPKHVSVDVCASIACLLVDLGHKRQYDVVPFVHMKLHAQNWKQTNEFWQQKVQWYMKDKLKIGNFTQSGIFHYTEKDFADKILERYQNVLVQV